jgi:hypothetical protein
VGIVTIFADSAEVITGGSIGIIELLVKTINNQHKKYLKFIKTPRTEEKKAK